MIKVSSVTELTVSNANCRFPKLGCQTQSMRLCPQDPIGQEFGKGQMGTAYVAFSYLKSQLKDLEVGSSSRTGGFPVHVAESWWLLLAGTLVGPSSPKTNT